MSKLLPNRFEPKTDDGRYCKGCSDCCRWDGEVIFSPYSLGPIAAFLNMEERECADLYFELAEDRYHLKAVETADGRCPFLIGDRCSIYHLRPPACQNFPYQWQRPEKELMRRCRLYRALVWRHRGKNRGKPFPDNPVLSADKLR